MPNHVKTVVKISKLKREEKMDLLNRLCRKDPDDPLGYYFDFNKLIPEPKTIEECPNDCIRTEKSCIEPDEDKPWFDWYAWRSKYWHTKWNTYSAYTIIKNASIHFVFNTAWSPATPVFEKLLELYDYEIEIRWADEDWGHNCGKIIHHKGARTHTTFLEDDLTNSRNFSKSLWEKY